MKRSESQSLYNALPGAYITYTCNARDSLKYKQADKTVLKIEYWKTDEIDIGDVYYPKIVSQIIPDIVNFKSDSNNKVEVDGSLLNLIRNRKQVEFLEAHYYKNEDRTQIYGHINPKMFYCPKCGNIKFIENDNDISKMICTNDKCEHKGRRLFQYNRIWVCSCGLSYPIDSYDLDPNKYRYFANRKDGFVNSKGESERIKPKRCICGNLCSMENATDPKAFYPRIITSVKLTDDNDASLCESKEGQDLIIERQIGKITDEEFKNRAALIKNKQNNPLQGIEDTADFGDLLNNIIQGDAQNNTLIETDIDDEVVYKILEYNTLKRKIVTSLDESINNAIKCEKISEPSEMLDMIKALKISNIFSVANIEIINTFAFRGTPIKSFTIESSVKNIRIYAFADCTNLKKVTFLSKDVYIDDKAFGYVYNTKKELFLRQGEMDIIGYRWSTAEKYANRDLDFSYYDINVVSSTTTIPTVVKPTKLTLNRKSVVLTKYSRNTGTELNATVTPTNATNKSVIWKSSNPKVAKVDSKGNVTTVSKGTCIITATSTVDSKVKATCKVTVVQKVVSVNLSAKSKTIKKGKSFTLKATVLPTNANIKSVTFTSTNKKVATVNSKGKVTAKKSGKTTIIVTTKDGKKRAKCTVKVK